MSIVKTIIDDWDPINLLSHAPDDEYHSEIREIECLLNSTKDYRELAEGIYNIFLKSFGEITFQKTVSECAEIAKIMLSKNA